MSSDGAMATTGSSSKRPVLSIDRWSPGERFERLRDMQSVAVGVRFAVCTQLVANARIQSFCRRVLGKAPSGVPLIAGVTVGDFRMRLPSISVRLVKLPNSGKASAPKLDRVS